MAKASLIQRELKRDNLVAKYAAKHAELKAIANDFEEERRRARCCPPGPAEAPAQRQPHAPAQPLRNHRSSARHLPPFGLGRAKIRELAFNGDIPGVTKASW